MKAYCALLAMVAALLSLPLAAQVQPQPDQTKILALENVWNLAIVHKNIRALDQLLAENFAGTDVDGSFMNKAQFLRAISDKNYRPQQMLNEAAQVHPHANSAVVTGIYREKGTDNGKAYDFRARFTDTWVFEDGEWRCAASHASLLPGKKGY